MWGRIHRRPFCFSEQLIVMAWSNEPLRLAGRALHTYDIGAAPNPLVHPSNGF
jgi:hypothetical protein